MKNLLNKIPIEKLEVVPIEHLADRPTQAVKAKWYGWKHGHSDNHKVGDYYPSTIASRIIEKNIGKSFDLAFAHFCKIVPKYQQKEFLEEFEARRGDGAIYLIDGKGNIQYNKNTRYYQYRFRYKGPYVFTSDDYETELRHKITGHRKKDFEAVHEKRRVYIDDNYLKYGNYYYPYNNGKLLYYEYGSKRLDLKPSHMRYTAQESDFEAVIIKGWEKVFKSKNDPEYKRLVAEREKRKSISLKKKRIEEAEKAYNFISKSELQKKIDKQFDNQKILSHGFDFITSFRTDKQTNPDLIQLKQ